MSDLISRSTLVADIEESVVFTVKGDAPSAEMRGANKIIDRIKAAPAVDAVEVVRGEWNMDGKNHCHCSCCSSGRNIETQIGWNFCPNCGADMRERKGDDG